VASFWPNGNGYPRHPGPGLLGTMFSVFNASMLSVAIFIFIYVVVVGVLKTANEGEFLGKNWNSFWVPLRLVLGVASLVPSSDGYSTIQMIVMWIVLQGIGLGDSMWTAMVDYVSQNGSVGNPRLL